MSEREKRNAVPVEGSIVTEDPVTGEKKEELVTKPKKPTLWQYVKKYGTKVIVTGTEIYAGWRVFKGIKNLLTIHDDF